MLRLAFLGPPVVERDGEPATFDTRKSIATLALLAVSPERRTRDGLAASLWPESDDVRARASLRRTLSVTAAAAGPSLEISRTTVGLDRSTVWCDLWEFDRLAERDDRRSLAQAASLYRSDFLDGFRARAGAEFDLWQERTAEEHRQRLSAVLSRLVTALVDAGALGDALRQARRWLALDDLHEPAHQALMRVLCWADQRTAALAQYRSCVRVLAEELGVEPLAETTALYEAIRANELGPAPAGDPQAGLRGPRRSPSSRLPENGASANLRPLPFVGQERIVASLLADAERCGDAGRVAVVAGPGGSGKTRIVEELRTAAGGRPWVRARCQPGEQWLELGSVAELLRSALACRPDLATLLDPHDLTEVARVVPEVEGAREVAAGPLETPGAQLRFFGAVTAAVRTALEGAPSGSGGAAHGVLVAEDAQHLDETSSRLLAYLLRRLDELPALVVLTWQPEAGLPAALTPVLDELAAAGRCTSYEPEPLGVEEVARLLEAAGLPARAAGELLARTGGLPLLVEAYAEALSAARADGDAASGAESGWLPSGVPTSVRPLLVQRLSAVSQTTAQILAAAAVLGGGFDADLLRATSGRSPMEVADAVDEAVALRLVVERPMAAPAGRRAPTYDFPYDALRTVAYESCGGARRRLLHNRAAEVLARRAGEVGGSARSAAVSTHLELAGRPEEAAEWSWRAAQRSLSFYARQEALDHLGRALELGHPATETHLAIADVLITLGRYREALIQLERAAADASGAGRASALIEHRLAAVQDRLGNTALAAAHLEAALDAADDPALRARILADRAFVAYRSRLPDADARATRALEAAQETGDAAALAQAHNVTGVLAWLGGDPRAAEASLRASLAAASSLDDAGLAVASLNNLARLLADLGRPGEALSVAEDALARGAEHGDVHRLAALHSNLADLLHAAGRGEESITHLKESAAAFAEVDPGEGAVPGVWTLTEW